MNKEKISGNNSFYYSIALAVAVIIGSGYSTLKELKEHPKKSFDLTIPLVKYGPIMWREIGANCIKFQDTSYWVLMHFGGFVNQNSLFLHTTDGDSGLIAADPLSTLGENNRIDDEYFDESIRDTAAQFENSQTVKAYIFTKTFNNKCFSVVYKIEPALLDDEIEFQERRNSLFKK